MLEGTIKRILAVDPTPCVCETTGMCALCNAEYALAVAAQDKETKENEQ